MESSAAPYRYFGRFLFVSPSRTHADLVTLIITTSPTPSAPSTELLDQILQSFDLHCPTLSECRVILVLDTYDRVGSASRLKKGQVLPEGAACYEQYKENAKRVILDHYSRNPGNIVDDNDGYDDSAPDLMSISYAEAEYGADTYHQTTNAANLTITRTHDDRIIFIEPAQRIGFGLAVRSALRLTTTPYVWIQQHDWSLVSDIPLGPLLDLMTQQQRFSSASSDSDPNPDIDTDHPVLSVPIKYVCFPSVRMLSYAVSAHVRDFAALRALTNLYKGTFSPPPSSTTTPSQGPKIKIPLTPLFFWHDKPHLAETQHYLAQVFPNRLAMPRGGFIEDTVGQRARDEMKGGLWRKWACWLYYPDEGKRLCVRHLKGRTWRGTEAEARKKVEWLRRPLSGLKLQWLMRAVHEPDCGVQ
ncbi:hypothetical protein QBC34DRAFT_484886 [Podospora aff. communis PSN243]|uniref:Uncharacterized protein n=1 Tax=Podospora aff. communis PSN243 TaxID=3040156 RepID=A0AAV9GMF2_9PEZI|nr:hypothetical protein QBC34DRAFT_484886 [Podospora aff. communis PSN243]